MSDTEKIKEQVIKIKELIEAVQMLYDVAVKISSPEIDTLKDMLEKLKAAQYDLNKMF